MSLMLNGIGVSRGVAIGRAHFIRHDAIEVLESAIPAGLVEDEVSRFRNAVETARLQLNAIRDRIPAGAGADISAIEAFARGFGHARHRLGQGSHAETRVVPS